MGTHHYTTRIAWQPREGETNSDYTKYSRNWTAEVAQRTLLHGSADKAFRGDPARVNPEELFLASIGTCHMLWYLHLAYRAGLEVSGYVDSAEAVMVESGEKGGSFEKVLLKPSVTFVGDDRDELAHRVHHDAHAACFIANSLSVPVEVQATHRFVARD